MYNVSELAGMVQAVGHELGIKVDIRNTENPRTEREEHYYNPDHQHLLDLGYQPTQDVKGEIRIMLQDLCRYRDRIKAYEDLLLPDIRWDGRREKVKYLTAKPSK